MNTLKWLLGLCLWLSLGGGLLAQDKKPESVSKDAALLVTQEKGNTILDDADSIRKADSLEQADIQSQIESLRSNDKRKKEMLQKRLDSMNQATMLKNERIKKQVDSIRANTVGIPVLFHNDTLLYIYSNLGPFTPSDRAKSISDKISKISGDNFSPENFKVFNGLESEDLYYDDLIILSVTERDAFWLDKTPKILVEEYKEIIIKSVETYLTEHSLIRILLRIGMVVLVIVILYFMVKYLNKGFSKLVVIAGEKGKLYLKGIKIKNYEVLTFDRLMQVVLFLLTAMKWLIIVFIVYSSLPIIFSVFPATEGIAKMLISYVTNPLGAIIRSMIGYIPELITIIVIALVTRYFVKFLRFLAREIEEGKLVIPGFYPDWAKPTFSLVSFIVTAFAFVVIFPYLPGSDSPVFQGVSVFLGLLISLGSSSAIGNMIAGLVITYMRPFKIGERVKIGDTVGDVIEKTMLVTRLRTVKNEDVTIPNAAILNGQTVNYSSSAQNLGLILHTTITIGYDVHWQKVRDCMILAAEKTEHILKDPKPFVLQTSLDDFYVSYQINAYTRQAARSSKIYSELHSNILDVFHKAGIEIMSPHFRAERDGSPTQIPGAD